MKSIAQTRTNAVSVQYALPMLLAVNTFALLPEWIKSAVALLLGF